MKNHFSLTRLLRFTAYIHMYSKAFGFISFPLSPLSNHFSSYTFLVKGGFSTSQTVRLPYFCNTFLIAYIRVYYIFGERMCARICVHCRSQADFPVYFPQARVFIFMFPPPLSSAPLLFRE